MYNSIRNGSNFEILGDKENLTSKPQSILTNAVILETCDNARMPSTTQIREFPIKYLN